MQGIKVNSLNDEIENLYTTFSPYRLGDDFVGCDCCVAPERSAKLAKKPLRRLTYDDLEMYASKAMSTWGDVRHFKHFLPRLFELTVDHRDGFLDLAVVFGKLSYGQWQTWPRSEFVVVDSFLRAYWEYQINQDCPRPQDDAIDTVLCAEASAYESVQVLLDTWLPTDSLAVRKHLAAFILWNEDDLLRKQRLSNPFWDRESMAYSEVIAWLRSDETFDYLNNVVLSGGFEVATSQLEAIRAAFEALSS